MTPTFTPADLNYTVPVLNSVASITITPTAADANATISINGTPVSSGSSSAPLPLTVGPNLFAITVTAQNGSKNVYQVTINRAPRVLSGNADLAGLATSSDLLNPAFTAATTNYDLSVPSSTTSITLTPTVSDANATVAVQGASLTSGTASAPISLMVGVSLPVTIRVTAENGSTKTYTVTVIREAPQLSSDNTLGGLSISGGASFSPPFNANTDSYNVTVPNATDRITLIPTAGQVGATIIINGVPVPSGSSSALNLQPVETTITITVTAEDGTPKVYTIIVTREAAPLSADANLAGLTTNRGEPDPSFDAAITAYTIRVENDITTIRLIPSLSDPNASVKVNGQTVGNGLASAIINLEVGDNPIEVVVTALNGTTKNTYLVTVIRALSAALTPTVFTPNADGINDTWMIPNIQLYPKCSVKVFNRGGQLIYSSVGYGTPWDGSYSGKALPAGVYYYIIDFKNNTKPTSGTISIVK